MNITTDSTIYFQHGFFKLNETILFSWIVMLILIVAATVLNICIKRKKLSFIQNFFEALITTIEGQIKTINSKNVAVVFPFIATLFIYILVANLISLIPNFESPTGSLSTTAAFAILTFLFSIVFGIKQKSFRGYLKSYFKPIAIMLPLNIIGQLSKVVSLSFRLYGNIMSSGAIIFILMSIPFLSVGFPVLINLLATISGVIQAYIFSILSLIAIASD